MNEQLIVKNFGPITDATVDFKKVTVFIGPTGGGKSTLAKLAAIFRKGNPNSTVFDAQLSMTDLSIDNYIQSDTKIEWTNSKGLGIKLENPESIDLNNFHSPTSQNFILPIDELNKEVVSRSNIDANKIEDEIIDKLNRQGVSNIDKKALENIINTAKENFEKQVIDLFYKKNVFPLESHYIPSERIFIAAIRKAWPGLISSNIGLPKSLSDFANIYFQARESVESLRIPFLNVDFFRNNEQDLIVNENLFPLKISEVASGIQSTAPMLVVLEYLFRQEGVSHSFIIEEPELNLYPTAQQGLMNWLVEKCTAGENDLTITTHSPYILSHLNLLLYAYQVADKHSDRADEVAQIVPRESWINPKEFACYQVENGGVQSLVNEELGLIDNNELDNLSGDAADAFDNLIRLSKSVTLK